MALAMGPRMPRAASLLRPSLLRPSAIDRNSERHEFVRRELVRHLPGLSSHARRLSRSRAEADDLVQAAVLRALCFAGTFEPGTNLKAWLHQVLDSVFLSGCRRRVRERRALTSLEVDPCAWIRNDVVPAMHALSPPVEAALARLPAHFREVVRLVDVEEQSYRDAAQTLEVPVGTIMSRLHRARRLLAQSLTETATNAVTSTGSNPLESAAPSAAAA
jgi:RNA polymerase sigma-70 factor (ECF subfamily)